VVAAVKRRLQRLQLAEPEVEDEWAVEEEVRVA
jgi:hypothetical protein